MIYSINAIIPAALAAGIIVSEKDVLPTNTQKDSQEHRPRQENDRRESNCVLNVYYSSREQALRLDKQLERRFFGNS